MKKDFFPLLFSALNERFPYAVLRNHEGLPEKCPARDIDLLVRKADLPEIREKLRKIAGKTGCRMLYQFRDHQFQSIVYLDPEYQTFQIDFQFNFAWMGIDLLDENELLGKRVFYGKVWHLPQEWTFLVKYLYCRILGADYPEKYAAVRKAALNSGGETVQQTLKKLSFGRDIGYWDKAGKWSLRFRTFTARFLHDPLRTAVRLTGYLLHTLKAWFFRRGPMISFSGPDGCGKTTVIRLLCGRLQVNPPVLFHFRPGLFPNLGETARRAGIIRTVDRNFSMPHRAEKKGVFNSLLRLAYYSADYILGYRLKVLPLRRKKRIILFDRYFTDIIADGERSSIFLNVRFLAFLRYFIPECQYNFIIYSAPNRILGRKHELKRSDIKRIYRRLEYLCSKDRSYHWISNSGSPEETVIRILDILASEAEK